MWSIGQHGSRSSQLLSLLNEKPMRSSETGSKRRPDGIGMASGSPQIALNMPGGACAARKLAGLGLTVNMDPKAEPLMSHE